MFEKHYCEMCEHGHPNLCWRLHFCGLYPDDGSLCQWMHMPAHTCFPVSDTIDDADAAMLEPLGIAIHAVDLARLRVADSVAILGAGPIGLLIAQLARHSGADPVFVSDRLALKHSTARRKGLTIRMSRRMQHTYPRAIRLAERGAVDLRGLISHRFPLAQAPQAFALNAAYQDGVVKIIVEV